MPFTKSLLKASRLLHLYLGVFTTPALIFFAITGGLQTFSFHETTRGSDYKPPKIIAELGMLHKKQNFVAPGQKPSAPAPKPASEKASLDGRGTAEAAPGPTHPSASEDAPRRRATEAPAPNGLGNTSPEKKKNLLPMKIFFLIVSVSLFLSTLTGLYMSYKYVRNKTLITASLIAGLIVPILLTFL